MTNEEFLIELENSYARSKKVLLEKEKEYSNGEDRLQQFYRAAKLQNISPTKALFGMMAKHIISIADMVEFPGNYTIEQWHEKTGDLRNYTILLEALLIDLGGTKNEL